MEQKIWTSFVENIRDKPVSLPLLASARSLISNPSTSTSTISAISAALVAFLDHPLLLSHFLCLVRHLTARYPHHRRQIFDSLASSRLCSHENARLAAESLSAMVSAASGMDDQFASALDDLGCDNLFVSLCFRPSASVRAWLLSNFESFGVRPSVMLTVFLGFTEDPSPSVRRIALNGLVESCKHVDSDCEALAEGCYFRAADLLQDSDDSVRRAAVRAVSEWGKMLVQCSHPMVKRERSDALFILVCSMARDMNAQVRIEAFDSLGNMEMVTGEILLQSLSKKVLLSTKKKYAINHLNSKQLQHLASSVSGAYAHGLEDEFSEVRESACRSLQNWTAIAPEFSVQALNWLVDVLNDDSYAVRLSALERMHHMAVNKSLNVQDIHLHMFLGSLEDAELPIRSMTRKILRLITFSNLEMFKTVVGGIMKSFETYNQDEADVISTMFTIGKNHGHFVIGITDMISEEVALLPDGKIRSCSGRATALLALAISYPLSNNQNIYKISPRRYSYALTLLRRISFGLTGMMDESTLVAYLVRCSALSHTYIDFKEGESTLRFSNLDSTSFTQCTNTNLEGMRNTDKQVTNHRIESDDEKDRVPASAEKVLEIGAEVVEYAQLILDNVQDIWLLIQSGCTHEVFEILRGCKHEVLTIQNDTHDCGGLQFFLLQYFQVIELLAKLWELSVQSHPEKRLHVCSLGELNIVLETLELTLRDIRYRLIGLICEEEVYILELVLLTHVVRLSSIDLSSFQTSLSKLSGALSYMENLIGSGSTEPSRFIVELRESASNMGSLVGDVSACQMVFKSLPKLFCLKSLTLCTRFKLLKAEIDVPGSDSENPLPFVAGLPVGVPLNITLYNISSQINLWVKMKRDDEIIEFVYLDQNQFGHRSDVTNLMSTVPFYNTPRAISFVLKVSIGMECFHKKNIYEVKKLVRGPKYDLAFLCQDVEIHFSCGNNR